MSIAPSCACVIVLCLFGVGCGRAHPGSPPDATTATDGRVGDGQDPATRDGSTALDAGSTAATGPCGGTTCRSGQSCVADACVYAGCTGATVPGDYATVQAAVNALEAPGGTICLGARAYDESVTVTANGGNLTISGVSAAQTSLTTVYVTQTSGNSGSITVQGLSTTAPWTAYFSGTLDIINCALTAAHGPTLGLEVGYDQTLDVAITSSTIAAPTAGEAINAHNGYVNHDSLVLTLDGVDLSSAASDALDADDIVLTVRNSFVHDSVAGLVTTALAETLVNNAFVRDATAVSWGQTSAAGGGPSFTSFNNLFVDNPLALAVYAPASLPSGQLGASAFWQNTTNFAGVAIDGSGDIKADPLLTTSTPPAPGAGSPCRGAADPAHAPSTDYWGNPRGATPDIGAVQSL